MFQSSGIQNAIKLSSRRATEKELGKDQGRTSSSFIFCHINSHFSFMDNQLMMIYVFWINFSFWLKVNKSIVVTKGFKKLYINKWIKLN